GGRLCLSLLEQMPERIAAAYLAAPDGLITRPWYRGLAASGLGRWAYKRFIAHPGGAHLVMDLLRASRLMGERMHRFLKGQTDSRAKRQLVHDVWLSYRRIEPDLGRVGANARAHGIPIRLYFGAFDRVIPPRLGANLARHAPGLVAIEELPFGHVLLTPDLGRSMARAAGSVPGIK
ncbi:MAG: hypothetical protein ACK4L7_03445, partial [Flavobacteriales bacterium]